MSVARVDNIPGFSIDRVAPAAGDDPDVLRLENLDTDNPAAGRGDGGDARGDRRGRGEQLAALRRADLYRT
ncbi:MAG TPA: hypothetical protein VFM83_07845 [Gaiellaceae bacterium]|nr:hypothetical protein [Gaiellaceae bacterium]